MAQLSDAVAARIRVLREARGWSQERLAENANLSRDAVSRIERGDRAARLDTLAALAEALGVQLSVLVDTSTVAEGVAAPQDRAVVLSRLLRTMPEWLSDATVDAVRVLARGAKLGTARGGTPRRPRGSKESKLARRTAR